MSWFFLWMEYGIISLISPGFYHNQDGVSEKFPQNCVFGFFCCFWKNDHLLSQTGLGPYFSLSNKPVVWILWRMARQFGQNPELKLVVWTTNKNGLLRCNGELCLQLRQIRLQRDYFPPCLYYFASLGRVHSCFPPFYVSTEKITLQKNWEVDFRKKKNERSRGELFNSVERIIVSLQFLTV